MNKIHSGLRRLRLEYKKNKIEIKAVIKGKRFYCQALAGESNYDISINSDMTVSCSCADFDGSGILGDFSSDSFETIFGGGFLCKEF